MKGLKVLFKGLVDRKLLEAPSVILLLAVPRRLFSFGFL